MNVSRRATKIRVGQSSEALKEEGEKQDEERKEEKTEDKDEDKDKDRRKSKHDRTGRKENRVESNKESGSEKEKGMNTEEHMRLKYLKSEYQDQTIMPYTSIEKSEQRLDIKKRESLSISKKRILERNRISERSSLPRNQYKEFKSNRTYRESLGVDSTRVRESWGEGEHEKNSTIERETTQGAKGQNKNVRIDEAVEKKMKDNTEDKSTDIKEQTVLQKSRRLKCTFCLLGCLTICGMRNAIVRKLAFSPPEIRGYVIKNEQFICISSRIIEFDDIVKKHNLVVKYCLIKKCLNKVASVFIYKKPLNLEKQIILFSHGNSTDIGHMSIFFLNLVLYCNINLIAYDYSGYGYSNKKPSERNIYKNITIVYNYIINTLKINPQKIIIYGHSIGSACNCYLLSRKNVKLGGCILHSPLASGLRLLLHFENTKIPWFDVFKNVERLQNITPVPIFLMHGKKDRQVPYAHSVHLKNVLTENFERKRKNQKMQNNMVIEKDKNDSEQSSSLIIFWGIENADHNDIEEKNTIIFYQKIKDFLNICEKYRQEKN